jgi:hypothetical protein
VEYQVITRLKLPTRTWNVDHQLQNGMRYPCGLHSSQALQGGRVTVMKANWFQSREITAHSLSPFTQELLRLQTTRRIPRKGMEGRSIRPSLCDRGRFDAGSLKRHLDRPSSSRPDAGNTVSQIPTSQQTAYPDELTRHYRTGADKRRVEEVSDRFRRPRIE